MVFDCFLEVYTIGRCRHWPGGGHRLLLRPLPRDTAPPITRFHAERKRARANSYGSTIASHDGEDVGRRVNGGIHSWALDRRAGRKVKLERGRIRPASPLSVVAKRS